MRCEWASESDGAILVNERRSERSSSRSDSNKMYNIVCSSAVNKGEGDQARATA